MKKQEELGAGIFEFFRDSGFTLFGTFKTIFNYHCDTFLHYLIKFTTYVNKLTVF